MRLLAGSPVSPADTGAASPLAGRVPAEAHCPSAGLVPYSTVTVVAVPRELTEPETVAVELVMAVAAPVLAVGGISSDIFPIAFAPRSLNHRLPSGPVVILSPSS